MNCRFAYILCGAFLIVGILLSRSNVPSAYACDTSVSLSGADCSSVSGQSQGNSDNGNVDNSNTNNAGNDNNAASGNQSGSNNNNNTTTSNRAGVLVHPDNPQGDNTADRDNGIAPNTTSSGSCSPGTTVQQSVALPVSAAGITVPGVGTVPLSTSSTYTLPNGSVVSASGIPSSMCMSASTQVDACTGEVVGDSFDLQGYGQYSVSACPNSTPPPTNPCDKLSVGSGGVTCTSDLVDGSSSPGSQWELTVHTPWPGAEIHTRPYPVTLVNWDTVMRVMGLGSTSSSGHLDYAAWGGGNENNPAPGDWKDIILRLEIKPVADWAEVFLENIGLIRMHLGELHTFQWNLPSHPAAGGGPLSGQVGQLEELEPDVPLYTNWTRAPYMVYCTISYYEWTSKCVGGAGDNGELNCRKNSAGVFTGHTERLWKRHSKTTPITPQMAINNVPGSLLADLNGDGIPDAYWGRLSFIRRMDDAGNVDNPEWAHSYSWGPVWYWAAREAQGQIGWPGVPVP